MINFTRSYIADTEVTNDRMISEQLNGSNMKGTD